MARFSSAFVVVDLVLHHSRQTFTPPRSYTKFSHQGLTPPSLYTKASLHQVSTATSFYSNKCYTKIFFNANLFLHQQVFTLLHQQGFTPTTVYTNISSPASFYINICSPTSFHTSTVSVNKFLHQQCFTPAFLFTSKFCSPASVYTNEVLHQHFFTSKFLHQQVLYNQAFTLTYTADCSKLLHQQALPPPRLGTNKLLLLISFYNTKRVDIQCSLASPGHPLSSHDETGGIAGGFRRRLIFQKSKVL